MALAGQPGDGALSENLSTGAVVGTPDPVDRLRLETLSGAVQADRQLVAVAARRRQGVGAKRRRLHWGRGRAGTGFKRRELLRLTVRLSGCLTRRLSGCFGSPRGARALATLAAGLRALAAAPEHLVARGVEVEVVVDRARAARRRVVQADLGQELGETLSVRGRQAADRAIGHAPVRQAARGVGEG